MLEIYPPRIGSRQITHQFLERWQIHKWILFKQIPQKGSNA